MNIDSILSEVVKRGASDLHLAVANPPMLRVDDELIDLGVEILSNKQVENLLFSVLNDEQKKQLFKQKEIDFSHSWQDKARFRVNIYYQRGVLSGTFRLIPEKIKTLKELGLPQSLTEFAKAKQGLVLAVGPAGHGKSTTLASLVDIINHTRKDHIITIEDPIEYLFIPDKCLVDQRELYHDTLSFSRALRSVLREDADVIKVGEMRDLETFSAAITIAETGHLVFSTLHTNSAAETVDRIIDMFPAHQQRQITGQLANVVLGIISQRLIPKIGGGRVVAIEVLKVTPAVRNLIREGKTYQLDSVIQTSMAEGMISLDRSLAQLVKKQAITLEDALSYARDRENFGSLLD